MCQPVTKIQLDWVRDVLRFRFNRFTHTKRYAYAGGVKWMVKFGEIKNEFDLMLYRERAIFG
jgi:hypothetical protein